MFNWCKSKKEDWSSLEYPAVPSPYYMDWYSSEAMVAIYMASSNRIPMQHIIWANEKIGRVSEVHYGQLVQPEDVRALVKAVKKHKKEEKRANAQRKEVLQV